MASGEAILVSASCLIPFRTSWWHMTNISKLMSRCSIFSKALNVVPHQRLLGKLRQYGINGHILKWISEFLSGRTLCVVVDGAASSWSAVESGCRRGPFSALCCSSFISMTYLIVLSPRSVYSWSIIFYIEPLRVFLINWLYKVT